MDIKLPVQAQEQAWANGCEHCRYGLVKDFPLSHAVPFYEERAIQAGRGQIGFCTCRAGHMQRQYLRRLYGAMTPAYRAYLIRLIDEMVDMLMLRDAVDEPTIHEGVSA